MIYALEEISYDSNRCVISRRFIQFEVEPIKLKVIRDTLNKKCFPSTEYEVVEINTYGKNK